MSGNYSRRVPDTSRLPPSPASLLKTSNGFISVFNKEPSASEPWLGLTAEVSQAPYDRVTMGG